MPTDAVGERATRRRTVEGGLNPPGDSVDADLRDPLESRWGIDIGEARVHSDRQAQASADPLNAAAYTFGMDIVRGSGNPSSGKPQHQELLAHELAHVAQQHGTAGSLPGTISTDQAAKTQAHRPAESCHGPAAQPSHRGAWVLGWSGSGGAPRLGGWLSLPASSRHCSPLRSWSSAPSSPCALDAERQAMNPLAAKGGREHRNRAVGARGQNIFSHCEQPCNLWGGGNIVVTGTY